MSRGYLCSGLRGLPADSPRLLVVLVVLPAVGVAVAEVEPPAPVALVAVAQRRQAPQVAAVPRHPLR